MADPSEKRLSYSCLCPIDGTEKDVELIYTSNGQNIYWKNRASKDWCDMEATCKESLGTPPRCPIFLAAPRFLSKDA